MSRRADATASLDGIPHPVFTSHRTTTIELHKHLRALILDSTLPPGASLRQAELARVFGISPEPLSGRRFACFRRKGSSTPNSTRRVGFAHSMSAVM
ncbi:hypothetical protein EP51_46385 (plasmid) [Rhodococcus opacus]|uniref:GntR family transcriptional regulator n=1 Tax=Rhodococcus opacus TaxID=37919 RepID=A0A076F0A1_RHOOP|nr:hypothetical protein EP51_46385 [Rhodococcus opacus]